MPHSFILIIALRSATSALVPGISTRHAICHMLPYFTIQAQKMPLPGLLLLKKFAIMLQYYHKFMIVL